MTASVLVMKILFATETFPPVCGGGGWSTYYLAKSLSRNHDVTVIAAGNQEGNETDGRLIVKRIILPRLGKVPAGKMAYRYFADAISEEDVDVVQGQHSISVASASLAKEKTGIPTVGEVRDYWPICYQTTLIDKNGKFHSKCSLGKHPTEMLSKWNILLPFKVLDMRFKRKALNKCDAIVARSHFVKKMLEKNGFEKVRYIFNFIPESRLQTLKRIKTERIEKMFFVGKINYPKGADLALKTAKELDFPIWFAGRGSIPDNFSKAKFLGEMEQEEIFETMKNSILIFPSRWPEPLSRVLLEALASGTPVVSTNTGGSPEIIRNEETGILVNPNVQELKRGVQKLLENQDLVNKVVSRGKELIQSRFSENVVIENYIKMYEELIK